MYLKYLRQKIRYNPPVRLVFDGLARTGIDVTFFYIMHEGLSGDTDIFLGGAFDGYEFGLFNENDMAAIAILPMRAYSEENLLARLAAGQQCFGAKHKNQIAGFTWFDLAEINYKSYRKALKRHEAYLFDAYTSLAFRGKKLAPYIRYQVYRALDKIGRTDLYSVSDCFNHQSINFKKKLNAKIIERGIAFDILKKRQFHFQY